MEGLGWWGGGGGAGARVGEALQEIDRLSVSLQCPDIIWS